MKKQEQEMLICPNCGKQYPKSDLRRHCSNCFACTGCERYLCSGCDEVIEVVPIRPVGFKSSEQKK